MIKVKRIDHVGIGVESMAAAIPFYELLGIGVRETEDLSARGLKLAFLPVGESQVELLEPTDASSSVGKFLAKRGEGIHHICLAVEDIDAAVKELTAAGIKMIDQVPRPGGGGHRIAFIHPDSTHGVLVELLED